MKIVELRIEKALINNGLTGFARFRNQQGSEITVRLDNETCIKVLKIGLWSAQPFLDSIEKPYLYLMDKFDSWIPGDASIEIAEPAPDACTPPVPDLPREQAQ